MTTTTVSIKKINAMVQENRQLKTENQQLKVQSQRLRKEKEQLQARINDLSRQLNARRNDLAYGLEADGHDEFSGFLHNEQYKYPAYMSNAAVDLVNYMTAMTRIYHQSLCNAARQLGVNESEKVQGFTSDLSTEDSLPNFLMKILRNLSAILQDEALQRGYDEEKIAQVLNGMMSEISDRVSGLEGRG